MDVHVLQDPLLSESISNLLKAVICVAQTIANFKPQLQKLTATLRTIQPIIEEIVNLNPELDRTELECKIFKDRIKKAEKPAFKCSKVKRDFFKRFYYSLKLKNFNIELLNFFQIEGQVIQSRDIKQMLVVVKNTFSKVESLSADVRDMSQRTGSVGNHSGSTSVEREKYGWRVPRPPSGIVAFGEPLEKLKAAVLDGCDDCSVLVVAAPGGCGKTTLVKML